MNPKSQSETSAANTSIPETAKETLSLVSIKSLAPKPGKQGAQGKRDESAEKRAAWTTTLSKRPVTAGEPSPLGASLTASGVNFAIASGSAQEVYLVLFDTGDASDAGHPAAPADGSATEAVGAQAANRQTRFETIKVEKRSGDTWHVHVEGLKPGQLYGYRINGPHDPAHGLRFNPDKLLVDPYAKAFAGKFVNKDNLLLAYDAQAEGKDLTLDTRDNAAVVPKCIVVDDAFEWDGDARPNIPKEKLTLYEVHVKGFTAHPSSGVSRPGTYQGFIEKIPYLKDLGVNAVELLPVHEFASEDFLAAKGLTNYWGYNTIGFFAPESGYAAGRGPGSAVAEFKTLVKALHKAGIEVILDVVYNHTAEGNECGPTLCFKGVDNPAYYSLCGEGEEPQRHYKNYSGTGNTLNAGSPAVQRLVLDSLHYWAEVMHVDGFRFDLAACLGRDQSGTFSANGFLLEAIAKDPILNKLKLIAEPWDMEAYEVGSLPPPWSEWNGKFRDTFRKFAKGDAGQVKELAARIAGSPDLFGHNGRGPNASINFLTCHDGFTLYDLVSYNGKHNEPNQENNQDGANDNNSWNCGAEGESDDEAINHLRRQQAKNLFCQLLFSGGTPMITAGDEFLRTQRGNNNVYAQDNDISWMDWERCARNGDILGFVKGLLRFRNSHPVLQSPDYFLGEDKEGKGIPDIQWVGPEDGSVKWDDPELRCLGFQLDGASARQSQDPARAYRLFIVFNADANAHTFNLPALEAGKAWHRVIDTSLPAGEDFKEGGDIPIDKPEYTVNPRSTIALISKNRPG